MNQPWKSLALGELMALRGKRPAWPYRRGLELAVEPTALGNLALLAAREEISADRNATTEGPLGAASAYIESTGRQTCEWLKKIQQPDGSTPVTQRLLRPGWSTPYAIFLWSRSTGFESQRDRACQWLLSTRGHTFALNEENISVIGHDPTLVGWPWVSGTHSWVEPTSLAILALLREGFGAHPRVIEGTKLLLDRAIHAGGWNYGNKSVYGKQLRPQPGPTGIALLALAHQQKSSRTISLAIDYLLQTLPDVHAPVSLSWAILGLRAHNACPQAAQSWLAAAVDRTLKRPDAAMSLALMLLAASEQSVSLFLQPAKDGSAGREPPSKSSQLSQGSVS